MLIVITARVCIVEDRPERKATKLSTASIHQHDINVIAQRLLYLVVSADMHDSCKVSICLAERCGNEIKLPKRFSVVVNNYSVGQFDSKWRVWQQAD